MIQFRHMEFFVNGHLECLSDMYTMHFIYSLSEKVSFVITIDSYTSRILFNFDDEGDALILTNCYINIPLDFIEGTYERVTYSVKIKNKIVFKGSFPIIHSSHKDNLNIGFVSCNDNLDETPEWNTYHSQSGDMWTSFNSLNTDIIVHMGDQIYADSIHDFYMNNPDVDETIISEMFKELYVNTYKSELQSLVMRNVINLSLTDDHDYVDGVGTPGKGKTKDNLLFTKYYKLARKAINRFQSFPINIINAHIASYSICYGNYNFICLSTRDSLYEYSTSFHSDIINYCKNKLYRTKTDYNIVVLPRPLYNLGTKIAKLFGHIYSDAMDDSSHPLNIEGAILFKQMLFNLLSELRVKNKKTQFFIVSGDIHETFIQTHRQGDLEIPELVTSAVTRESNRYHHGKSLYRMYKRYINFKENRERYSDRNNCGALINNRLTNFF